MSWWWPFGEREEEPVLPYVQHVIDSLDSSPLSWSLTEETVPMPDVFCERNHPDAIKGDGKKVTPYSNGYKKEWWYRKVYAYHFTLSHVSGTAVLVDRNAKKRGGWKFDKPSYISMSVRDNGLLDDAVERWRQFMMKHEMSKHDKEVDPLEEAFKELEKNE